MQEGRCYVEGRERESGFHFKHQLQKPHKLFMLERIIQYSGIQPMDSQITEADDQVAAQNLTCWPVCWMQQIRCMITS
ncbi:hypothetical protein AAHA92_13945 [Salvia divinorum]|uniref:Uncharacterized protein n=1 Tax=Salvia divinorum TaxID=28513 RepID=A0ABD1H9Y9_SALDI